MPDEEEQYRAYRRVVEAFDGHAVIIRTYDIGGDKLPVGGYPAEPNPFLGWRAIRMCLDEPELFRAQLRALLRAAQHGDVRIMLPLVITLDEVLRARELLEESARELIERGVPHRASVPLGVMVETPAAAVAADTLAPHVVSSRSEPTISRSTRSPSIGGTQTWRRDSHRSIRRCCGSFAASPTSAWSMGSMSACAVRWLRSR